MATTARTLRAGPITLPQRLLAAGLVAYGLAGIVLALILVVALGPPDLAGLGRIDAERESIAQLIAAGEATASDGKAAVESAGSSVDAGADAATDTATFARQLSAAMRELAGSLRVEVLGQHPFETAATQVDQAADRADAAAMGLDRAAMDARAGAVGLTDLADDLGTAQAKLAGVREGLVAAGGVSVSLVWLRIVLIALALWLAVPAIACVLIGRRLWAVGAARQ